MIKQAYLFIWILSGIWLTACQDFEDPANKPSVVDGDMVEVSIKTNVPAITVQTRSTTEATETEKQLTHVDILVFEMDGTDEKFAYRTRNTNDLSGLDYTNDIEIKARLKISKNDEKYRVVFIANMEEEINAFFTENEEPDMMGTLKKELLKELTFTQEKIWADTDAAPHPLPMWGESNITAITKEMTSGDFGTLKLLRSVARIGLSVSIGNDPDGDGSDIFEIKSVKVYNARKTGLAAPEGALTEGKVTSPSLVTGSGYIDTDKAKYNLPGNAENEVTGLYINEASNQVDGEEVFLIIEAIYKGEDPGNQKATFYKIGFYDSEDAPVDILRNFTYNMIITSVTGEGEEEEEDAVNSTTSNLTVSMTDWSGGEYKYVIFNGKYYLAVSESEFTVPKQAGEYKLKVTTNYPGGWKAKVSKGNNWLTDLNPDSGIEETVSFHVAENGETERDGEISITCGDNHLSLEVTVRQTTQKEYTLNITIDDQNNIGSYIEFDKTITFTSGIHEYYETHPIPPPYSESNLDT
ncbi:MAG: fimbrial protein [Tannerellaceae bacterium]|nr:fimbrial protein [Tannerellaceae bacterium]